MSFIKFNPNPHGKQTGDCVVRAISIAEGKSWDDIFKELTTEAYHKKDMPSMNPLWVEYLEDKGYSLHGVGNQNVREFAYHYPYGTWILGTGSHAIAVIDGNYIDTWDSGNEQVMYALQKGVQDNDKSILHESNTDSYRNITNLRSANNSTDTNTAESEPAAIGGSVLGTGTGGSQGLPADNS